MKHFLKFIPLAVVALGLTLIVKFAVTKHPTSLGEFPAWMQFVIMLSYAVFVIIALVVLVTLLLTTKPKSGSQNTEQASPKPASQTPVTKVPSVRSGLLTREEMLALCAKAQWKNGHEHANQYIGYVGDVMIRLQRNDPGWESSAGGSTFSLDASSGGTHIGFYSETADGSSSGKGPIQQLYEGFDRAEQARKVTEKAANDERLRLHRESLAEEVRQKHLEK